MTLVAALLAIALFLLVCKRARIYPLTTETLSALREAVTSLRDRSRSDREKERLARQYSADMLERCARLSALIAVAACASVLLLLGLDALQLAEFRSVAALMSRWQFIAVAGAGTLAVWLLRR